jgi:hypothetical protein
MWQQRISIYIAVGHIELLARSRLEWAELNITNQGMEIVGEEGLRLYF